MISAADFQDLTRRDWEHADVEGTLRVAMIGIGWWTRDRAIPAVSATDRCETTVAVSSSAEKASSLTEEHETITHGITYEQFHDGKAADAYDAVYIATPNAFHNQYAARAAAFDKAILCEKPMADTVANASDLVDATTDVPLMVAYRMQTEPLVRRMRELIREGFVGSVVDVSGHMSQRVLDMIPDPDQWRLDPDLAGYGASVMDLGIYPLNTARFVLDRDPVRVHATMQSVSEGFERVPDERARFTVEFPDGITLSAMASQNATKGDHFSVIGTEGELTLTDGFHATSGRSLTLVRDGTRTQVDVEPVDQMEAEFAYFADRVLTGEPIGPDGEHGLVDMRSLKAIYEAAERGESVPIEH
jgi:D-xylose 1-dehydrogenase (NADP+, D-xylono-1,4-lactone-forming)